MRLEKEIISLYLKLHGFFVQQDVEEIDFVIKNPQPPNRECSDFLINSNNIQCINNAIMEMSIWQSHPVFYPSRLNEKFRILEEDIIKILETRLKIAGAKRIIIVDSLPRVKETKTEIINALQEMGFDHVLEFSEIIAYCVKNMDKLKGEHIDFVKILNYLAFFGFIKDSQLEFRL